MNNIPDPQAGAHVPHEELEHYTLSSSALSEHRARGIASHLTMCAHCLAVADEIAHFYTMAAAEIDEAPHAGIALVRRLRENASPTKGVIELFPRLPATLVEGARPNLIALAAQDGAHAVRYSTVGNLASPDGKILLHVLRDNSSNMLTLQVHADSPREYAEVLVTFNEIPGCYLTDRYGELSIPDVPATKVSQLHAFLRICRDRFRIGEEAREQLERDEQSRLRGEQGAWVTAKRANESVILVFEDSRNHGGGWSHFACGSPAQRSIAPVTGGEGRCSRAQFDASAEILAY
jgi:hypothetical protein